MSVRQISLETDFVQTLHKVLQLRLLAKVPHVYECKKITYTCSWWDMETPRQSSMHQKCQSLQSVEIRHYRTVNIWNTGGKNKNKKKICRTTHDNVQQKIVIFIVLLLYLVCHHIKRYISTEVRQCHFVLKWAKTSAINIINSFYLYFLFLNRYKRTGWLLLNNWFSLGFFLLFLLSNVGFAFYFQNLLFTLS